MSRHSDWLREKASQYVVGLHRCPIALPFLLNMGRCQGEGAFSSETVVFLQLFPEVELAPLPQIHSFASVAETRFSHLSNSAHFSVSPTVEWTTRQRLAKEKPVEGALRDLQKNVWAVRYTSAVAIFNLSWWMTASWQEVQQSSCPCKAASMMRSHSKDSKPAVAVAGAGGGGGMEREGGRRRKPGFPGALWSWEIGLFPPVLK